MPGDDIVCRIDGLGWLKNTIVADSAASGERIRACEYTFDRGVAVESRECFESVNPATQEVWRRSRAARARVDAAVAAQKRHFPDGRNAAVERAGAAQARDLIAQQVPELARTETQDTGQPIAQTPDNSCRAAPTTFITSPRCACASTGTPIRRRRTSTTPVPPRACAR